MNDRTAVVTLREPGGDEILRRVACAPSDGEATIRAHVARWYRGWEFVRVEFEEAPR